MLIIDSYTFLLYILLYTEEFVAHGSNVSCLSLGPSSGRVMVTGGEDRKVNMWAVGKPNVILVKHFPLKSVLHSCHIKLRLSKMYFLVCHSKNHCIGQNMAAPLASYTPSWKYSLSEKWFW